jgi:hypothetical protein
MGTAWLVIPTVEHRATVEAKEPRRAGRVITFLAGALIDRVLLLVRVVVSDHPRLPNEQKSVTRSIERGTERRCDLAVRWPPPCYFVEELGQVGCGVPLIMMNLPFLIPM